MLEVRDYTKAEMSAVLGTTNNQGIKNKLENYNVELSTIGSGNKIIFHITKINDPFKVFCITELGMDPRTMFDKLCLFVFYFLNIDEFAWLPDEVLEIRMDEKEQHVSRQTISKWKKKLMEMNIISKSNEYIYYFAINHTQKITDKETYKKAWREYFEAKEKGFPYELAINEMIATYGGVARKQAISAVNGIYYKEINDMVFQSMMYHYFEKVNAYSVVAKPPVRRELSHQSSGG